MRNKSSSHNILFENLNKKDNWQDLGSGNDNIKMDVKEINGRMLAVFLWLLRMQHISTCSIKC
jgi:hypothetical protein